MHKVSKNRPALNAGTVVVTNQPSLDGSTVATTFD